MPEPDPLDQPPGEPPDRDLDEAVKLLIYIFAFGTSPIITFALAVYLARWLWSILRFVIPH